MILATISILTINCILFGMAIMVFRETKLNLKEMEKQNNEH
jgi:hypothetical protein